MASTGLRGAAHPMRPSRCDGEPDWRYTPRLDSGRHRRHGPNPRPHRLARSGLQPFKLATRVRIPLGTPSRRLARWRPQRDLGGAAEPAARTRANESQARPTRPEGPMLAPAGSRSSLLACGSVLWIRIPSGTKPCRLARWRHQRDLGGAPRLRLGALDPNPSGTKPCRLARWRPQRDLSSTRPCRSTPSRPARRSRWTDAVGRDGGRSRPPARAG